MARQLLKAGAANAVLRFDPRTKLLLLVTMAVFVLGGLGGEMEVFCLALSFVPLGFFLAEKRWRASFFFLALFSAAYLARLLIVPQTQGLLRFLLVGVCGFLTRFMPSISMGMAVMTTTTVSEFVAAMQRMHVSQKIVIPLSVVFRFFPTIGDEFGAIEDAMRMRGVRFGGGKVTEMLEYRLIPMMICCVKIGEELSAAALTRGLGAPVKRTNICQIGFGVQDLLMIAICGAAFVVWFFQLFGVW